MNKRRKHIYIILLLIFVMLLNSCDKDSLQKYPPNVSLNSGQIFLFDPFSYKLGVYDSELMKWNEVDAQGGQFQSFGWGNVYPYFIVGSYNTQKYYAGKTDEATLRYYYSLGEEGAVLTPFATDGKLFLYIVEQMNVKPCRKRIITISEKGEAETLINLDGFGVMGGVIIGDCLYFVSPHENTEYYNIWSIDLTKDTHNQKPVLIKSDYTDYRLYEYKGKLLYLNLKDKILYNDETNIKLSHESNLIWIDQETDILVEEYVNSENSLEMSITNISTGTVLGAYADAINFRIADSVITVYGNGYIERLDLPKGD